MHILYSKLQCAYIAPSPPLLKLISTECIVAIHACAAHAAVLFVYIYNMRDLYICFYVIFCIAYMHSYIFLFEKSRIAVHVQTAVIYILLYRRQHVLPLWGRAVAIMDLVLDMPRFTQLKTNELLNIIFFKGF